MGMIADKVQAQIYTEEEKGTLVYLLSDGWDMMHNEFHWGATIGPGMFPSGFDIDNIIESHVFIEADPVSGKPAKALPFYRLQGHPGNTPWGGQYFLQCDNSPQCAVNMSRGPNGGSFFQSSSFSSPTAPRVYVKIDYKKPAGTSTGQSVNEYYFPINNWNMVTTATTSPYTKVIPLPNLDISKIADVSVTILSDPNAQGKIQVDYFDRRGITANPYVLARGGVIDVTPNGTSSNLTLTFQDGGGGSIPSNMFHQDPAHPFDPANHVRSYTSGSGRRGWVRVTYNGTATGVPEPYAIKSKFEKIGAWPINNGGVVQFINTLPFNSFGVGAPRIVHAEATTHSDILDPGSNEQYVTSLRRGAYGGGQFGAQGSKDQGLFTIDDSANTINLFATGDLSGFYYNSVHANGSPTNRGWFRIDYVAGSCEQGPTGFNIQAVPGTFVGVCNGTSQPFVIQGAGRGTPNFATTDSLTYVWKTANTANKTITVKVVSMTNANAAGLAGVMFRSTLAANSMNAAMVATNSTQGVYFRRRLTNGGQTQVDQNTAVMAPCWVRVVKVGNIFKAYYSTSTSNTMPPNTSFAPLGVSQTINFPTNYYVGMQVSNYTSPDLNQASFLGYTETSP